MQGIQPLTEPPVAPPHRRTRLLGLAVLVLLLALLFVLWRARGELPGPAQQAVSPPSVVNLDRLKPVAGQPAVELVAAQPELATETDPEEAQSAAVGSPFPPLEAVANENSPIRENSAGDEAGAEPLDPGQDPENEALGGVLTVFSIQPLAAPCCPLPTDDKAVDAARSLPGVLAAKVNDDGALLVRFDPEQTDADAIASAVNQASFIVEIAEQPE